MERGVAGIDVVSDVGEKIADRRSPRRPAFSHLFHARHHGILDCTKARDVLGIVPEYDFRSGHEATYRWFCESPLASADISLRDPLWGSGFDFDYEAEIAHAVRAPA